MDKSIDTQWMSARQVVLLAPEASEMRAQVLQILRLPRYVVTATSDLDAAAVAIGKQKVEVVLFEPEAGTTRSPAALERIAAADVSAEVIVLAPRPALAATLMALERRPGAGGAPGAGAPARASRAPHTLAGPFIAPELVQAVERVRELRYLRRSEERGRRAEARMSAVFQSAPHAIIAFDGRGLIHDWNPAAASIFGWSAAEAVGQPFWDLVGLGDHRGLGAQVSAARTTRVDVVARRRAGAEFPAILSLSAIVGAELSMCCAIVEDVTEARRMEVELRHAQKLEAVGRLAAGLAHEINTPCQFIGTNAEFLAQAFAEIERVLGAHDSLRALALAHPALEQAVAAVAAAEDEADLAFLRERAPRALADIMDGVRRVSGIVAAMKQFAQPDVREATSIDVNQALTDTLTVVASATTPVAEVIKDFAELPLVTGFAGELNQAFLQIVLNAAHAIADRHGSSGERGRITVRTRAPAGAVLVDIEDTGGGIPEAIRSRIFEPFFTTKDVGRGTGQGLPVARSVIVDRHRGTLTFDSTVGQGTTFHISLPLVPPA